MSVSRFSKLALFGLVLSSGFLVSSTGQAATPRIDAHALMSPAELSVTHGNFRYVAATNLAQLAVLRPDGTQSIIHLPGVASALFVHENQLYVGFPSGDLQVFDVKGDQAANPVLALRHRYPHAVAGFALTNGQVVALPAQGAQPSPQPQPQPAPAPAPAPAPSGPPEPKSGVGLIIVGALLGGGVGVPTFAIGLNRRLDREGDGIGLLSIGGTALGVGIIAVGVGASQAATHRRWAKKQYGMRLSPSFAADHRGNWSVGANLRF